MFRTMQALLVAGYLLIPGVMFAQTAEHPLFRPNSYGANFEGPALALKCVALLKNDSDRIVALVRAMTPEARRSCVGELVQSLSPEPDFTPREFEEALLNNPYHNLTPTDPQLAQRMMNRLGVNLAVSDAIDKLARAGLIDDAGTVRPLIHCLDHPLIDVAYHCHTALTIISQHSYGAGGVSFYYRDNLTVERRDAMVKKWADWELKYRGGHLLVDDWLKSEIRKTLGQLESTLAAALRDARPPDSVDSSPSVASAYLTPHPEAGQILIGTGAEILFRLDIGDQIADNWPRGKVQEVSILVSRPGIEEEGTVLPGGVGVADYWPDHVFLVPPDSSRGGTRPSMWTYTETFSRLDLSFQVGIRTSDKKLRDAFLAAAKKGLAELRLTNEEYTNQR